MKLRPEQLGAHLQGQLAAIYLVSGDEPLQQQEACDAILQQAKQQGFTERQRIDVDAKFDWQQLSAAANSRSLFSNQTLIDLNLGNKKPGSAGSKAFIHYTQHLPKDKILLIRSQKLDGSAQKSKWYQALDKAGVTIQVWPINPQQMPGWLKQQAQQFNLTIETNALQSLAEYSEGNLLSAKQTLEKLSLVYANEKINLEMMRNNISQASHYDVFDLMDACLQGDVKRVVTIAHQLKQEGLATAIINWAIARELRLMISMQQLMRQGQNFMSACKQQRIWQQRQAMVKAALNRHNLQQWQRLLQQAAKLDRLIKGAETGNVWDNITNLCVRIAR